MFNDKDYWGKKLENLEYGFCQRTKILWNVEIIVTIITGVPGRILKSLAPCKCVGRIGNLNKKWNPQDNRIIKSAEILKINAMTKKWELESFFQYI